MIGTKIYKPLDNEKRQQYTELAEWCNNNGAFIHETGEYYVAMPVPAPSHKEALLQERNELKVYLSETDWIVVKCMERGLNIQTEYPEAYQKRGEARARIDEIDEELGN